jgi:hypothetical protein
MLGDDGRTIAIDADPKRVAPFAAAPDVDRIGAPAGRVFVENPAHLNLRIPLRKRRRRLEGPPVILKGDKSSVVGRDSDVIMGSGGISVGIMGQQTSGHAEMNHQQLPVYIHDQILTQSA